MRIDSSTVAMSSWRSYTAEAEETKTTINRSYNGDSLIRENAFSADYGITYHEIEGGASIYTTSSAGVDKKDDDQVCRKQEETKELAKNNGDRNEAKFQFIAEPRNSGHWISSMDCNTGRSAEIELVKKMLDALNQFRERNGCGRKIELPLDRLGNSHAMRSNASAASVKYQQSMAMFSVQSAAAAINARSAAVQSSGGGQSVSAAEPTHWTRQTVQSGFIAGQESMAFCATGNVVTSDGSSIEFNVTMEMSRSFAAAYEITSAEESYVYTDPLVINMDTDGAAISDVSFYFDLNNDGTAEEISGLDEFSGFLALDKNGDGEINNGGELFGAATGDGFKELAAYDGDGNGWIDENDDVFSKLRVWIKCGSEDAQLLSLKEADVGAIFLGSQATNYTLADSEGEEGAMVRKTGIYLKESGGAGTVQHVDFKA